MTELCAILHLGDLGIWTVWALPTLVAAFFPPMVARRARQCLLLASIQSDDFASLLLNSSDDAFLRGVRLKGRDING